MNKPIYLDYNATTPLDPRVLEAMMPYLKEDFGNPSSSSHSYGWEAKAAVDTARQQVAEALHCALKEVIWTSGATESNNFVFHGLLHPLLAQGQTPHIITSSIEHKAVLDVAKQWEHQGAELTIVDCDAFGMVSAEAIAKALRPNTVLVSVMMANNEVGTINPVAEIGALCNKNNILFHTDAAQSFGKVDIDVKAMNIDFLSISGHKIYGPKGVGALFINQEYKDLKLHPMFFGGQQERTLRPGTLNVPGIVGLGKAAEIACHCREEDSQKLKAMQKHLVQQILTQVEGAVLNGHPEKRLCNNISFSFKNLSADLFALGLSGLAVSSGSACTSDSARPSHVLLALGHPECLARATLRIGLGRLTSKEDIDTVIEKIMKMSKKNEAISSI